MPRKLKPSNSDLDMAGSGSLFDSIGGRDYQGEIEDLNSDDFVDDSGIELEDEDLDEIDVELEDEDLGDDDLEDGILDELDDEDEEDFISLDDDEDEDEDEGAVEFYS